MKPEEYIRIQTESSAWTRKSKHNMDLVYDTINEFCKYTSVAGTVLEIGSGDGYALDLLRDRGFRKVYGCDMNFDKLAVAVAQGHNVSVQDMHCLAMKDNSVDAIYCTHTLEHSHNGYQAIHEMFRILRPNGVLFVIVPDHTRLYGETYVSEGNVVPIEERTSDFFVNQLQQYGGTGVDPKNRNQFPLSMKLLYSVLDNGGFEIQWIRRTLRDGPELWSLSTKPLGGLSDPERWSAFPWLKRPWRRESLGKKWRSRALDFLKAVKKRSSSVFAKVTK